MTGIRVANGPVIIAQTEFALPARPSDETIEERLAELVSDFNEAVEPFERAELMQRIRRLRDLLGGKSTSS